MLIFIKHSYLENLKEELWQKDGVKLNILQHILFNITQKVKKKLLVLVGGNRNLIKNELKITINEKREEPFSSSLKQNL